MAALAGREIVGVTGTAERGYVVAYRDPDGGLGKALVPPQERHPDFQIVRAYLGGASSVPAPARDRRETDFFRV